MKDYKKLAPVLIIFMAVLACYSRINNGLELQKEYDGYLNQARTARDEKIYVDSKYYYNEALKMYPSLDIYLEAGAMLVEEGNKSDIEKWEDTVLELYPKEPKAYEYAIEYEKQLGDYKRCFELSTIVQKRGIATQELVALMDDIQYEYSLGVTSYEWVFDYNFEYAIVKENEMYGLVSTSGNEVLDCKYIQMGVYSGEVLPVQDENKEFNFIDIEGNRKLNIIDNITISRLGSCRENVYTAGINGEMYYVDMANKVILGPYEDAGAFNNGIAAVKKDGIWYLIDKEGNTVSKGYVGFAQDAEGLVVRNSTIMAQTMEGYILLGLDGKQIGDMVYEDVRHFADKTYAAVKIDGKWGFIDNQGQLVLEAEFEDAKSFQNGYAPIKKNGKWGYIDMNGNIVIRPVFQQAQSISSKGVSYVQDETGKWKKLELLRNKYSDE